MNNVKTDSVSSGQRKSGIDITRTFVPFRESASEDTDFEFWFQQAQGRTPTWDGLLKERLVVVLGEAGIGKTYEFRRQAERLQSQAKAAFFIPLNLLERPEDWDVALDKQVACFEEWKSGTDIGMFFLDAVDEARLTGPVALQRSLRCVRQALTGHLHRVSIFVSSRVSDWNLPAVRALVEKQFALPIVPPLAQTAPVDDESVTISAASEHAVKLVVYSLAPLSVEAARRLAAHYGVAAVDAFWQEVDDGNYRFLATRPLDLQWMAVRWQGAGRLGSFAAIIEAAVTNRLVEKNHWYTEAGAVLSSDQLRQGAEALAAASIFSGAAYFQVEPGVASSGAIAPAEALPEWKANEHQRLLGSAVFDEATYGRVQFHHRTVREYLAAWWVKRRIDARLPFDHAWALFAQAPFGEEVLIPSRRPVLCWLAALDAKVRARVIRSFPEMVIFEGDPQQWSADDAVDAFDGYLDRLKSGYRPDWSNDASEFRRVARVIPAATLSRWIDAHQNDLTALPRLLTLVTYGRVMSCADQIFALYRREETPDRLRRDLLETLAVVATTEHRASIAEDLLSGRLVGNDLIADGIKAVGLARLSLDQIASCFRRADAESEYGGGSMAIAVKVHLLPEATFAEALKTLAALLAALPTLDVQELVRRREAGEPREGWMLSLMPDVLLKVLELAPSAESTAEPFLIDSVLVVEKLRHTGYANDEDFRQLRSAIARFPQLRKHVALQIALSDIPHAVSALTWMSGVVYLNCEDIDWLVPCANETRGDPNSRAAWYGAARDIAFRSLRGKHRRDVLNELVVGPDADARRGELDAMTLQRIAGFREQRKWKHEEIARKQAAGRLDAENKAELLRQIDGIRAGSAFGAIKWLVVRASERSGSTRYTKANIELVFRDFGQDIGKGFDEGLARAWRHFDAPDSTKYLDNSVPWVGLVGLASANHAFRSGLDAETLTEAEIGKLARFCVWEIDRLEPWFSQLVEKRLAEVTKALAPWFEFELTLPHESPIRRTIDMVLGGPRALKRALLPIALERIQNRVPNERLRRKLMSELVATGLAGAIVVGRLAQPSLENGFAASPPVIESAWFSDWARADITSAWGWFEKNSERWPGAQEELVNSLGHALDSSSEVWKSLSGTTDEVATLVRVSRFLDAQFTRASDSGKDNSDTSPAHELSNRIPMVLSSLRGKHVHQGLSDLAVACADTPRRAWLMAKVLEQAAREAEDAARILPSELPTIGEPFTRQPRTEAELFEQVMARLAEIVGGVEKGPFSERGLFPARIPEKQLQLWLAARLEDTPRRSFTARFSVAREPTVDGDNRTDIEVSTMAGKVCIEIKPLDESRSYSAQSLTDDTLNRQVVGQYLRGKNSQHGVLVVFRLDRKRWQIPGCDGLHEFDELVGYLRTQAAAIVANNPHVLRLEVVTIDCTPST